jgi:Mg-chelatase subunit ChlD
MRILYFIKLWCLCALTLLLTHTLEAQPSSENHSQKTLHERYSVTQARDILYHETPTVRLRSSVNTPAGLSCDLKPNNFSLWQLPENDDCKYGAFDLHCIPPQPLEQIDIVFLLDDSGSMSDEIDAMKAEIVRFAEIFQENDLDARFALITNCDQIILESNFTDDPKDIRTALEGINTGGEDELTLDSIVFGLQNLEFRPAASFVFLCITDEQSTLRDYSMARVTQFMDRSCAMLIAVSPDYNPRCFSLVPDSRDMRHLAMASGGSWIDINSLSFSNLAFNTITTVYARTWTYYAICNENLCPPEFPPPCGNSFQSRLTDPDYGWITDDFKYWPGDLMDLDYVGTVDDPQLPWQIEFHVTFPYEVGTLPNLKPHHFIVLEEENELEVLSVEVISESTEDFGDLPVCQSYPLDFCTFKVVAKSQACDRQGEIVYGDIGFVPNRNDLKPCQYWETYSYRSPEFFQLLEVSISQDYGFPYREVIVEINTPNGYENKISSGNLWVYDNEEQQVLLGITRIDDATDPDEKPTYSVLYKVEDSQEDGISRNVCVRYIDSCECQSEHCSSYVPANLPGCLLYITSPLNKSFYPQETIDISGYTSCLGTLDPKPMDFLYVMDSSHSLNSTDPQDYRKTGALALLDSIDTGLGVRSGVISFGDQSILLQPLTSDLDAVRAAINSLEREGGTQMARAIDEAVEVMLQQSNPSAHRFIILFSDGVPTNIEEAKAAARLSPVPINTIFLGNNVVGNELMSQIAADTDGTFFQVQDPSQLPNLFVNYNQSTYIHKIEVKSTADSNFSYFIPASEIINGRWSATDIPLMTLENDFTTISAILYLQGNPSYERIATVNIFFGTPMGIIFIGM